MSAADEADRPCWVSVMSFLHRLLLNANTSSQLLGESAHLLTLVLWRKFPKKSFKRLHFKKQTKTNSWNLRHRLFFLTGSSNWNLSASLVTDWKLNQLVQTSPDSHECFSIWQTEDLSLFIALSPTHLCCSPRLTAAGSTHMWAVPPNRKLGAIN